jgi:metal-responsive CopG/Arc/MetJ family transcriptional regulator
VKSKITIALDQELLTFLDERAKGNRSEYISSLLTTHKQQTLEAELIAALKQDMDDATYRAELADWDSVAGDGIHAGG